MNKSVAEYASANPPRCLDGFRVEAESEATTALRLKFPADCCAIFELLPPNDQDAPIVYGNYLADYEPPHDLGFTDPIFIEWSPSGARVNLFDRAKNGWDAECGIEDDRTPVQAGVPWKGNSSNGKDQIIVAVFNYDIDWEDLHDDILEHPQDWFDHFFLYRYDKNTKTYEEITQVECA